MTKKTRFIAFILCLAVFFIAAPYIVFYSLGYRISFANRKIVATGGIYVRAVPDPTEVVIDSKIRPKPGIFSNTIFIQNLLPQNHRVTINKEGYHTYEKTIEVKENEVTKLEYVVLFKKDISFAILAKEADYFSLAPDNNHLLITKAKRIIKTSQINSHNIDITNIATGQIQSYVLQSNSGKISDITWSADSTRALVLAGSDYFLIDAALQNNQAVKIPYLAKAQQVLFSPQSPIELLYIKDKNLYADASAVPIIKNVVSYALDGSDVIWLSYDGYVYSTNLSTKDISPSYNDFPLKINLTAKYEMILSPSNGHAVFVKENNIVWLLNRQTKKFSILSNEINSVMASPDNRHILFCGDHSVSYSPAALLDEKMPLGVFEEKISGCQWINNKYIMFSANDRIIISEIDIRGNVNMIDLPKMAALIDDTSVAIKNPKIVFNRIDKKLYLLTQDNMIVSEELLP